MLKSYKIYLISFIFFISNLFRILKLYFNNKFISKKKKNLFILGSGSSINEITKSEWKKMSQSGDFLSFNHFYKFSKVKIKYHVIREMSEERDTFKSRINGIDKYISGINNNINYLKTIFFINIYPFNIDSQLLLKNKKVFLETRRIKFFSNSFSNKRYSIYSNNNFFIPHFSATLFDAINLGVNMNYNKIILVGIDLYNRDYFWLKKNEIRKIDIVKNKSLKDKHDTAEHVLNFLPKWNYELKKDGKEIFIYNPKSLLSKKLNIYKL